MNLEWSVGPLEGNYAMQHNTPRAVTDGLRGPQRQLTKVTQSYEWSVSVEGHQILPLLVVKQKHD